jgi:hypothetical protein
MSGARTKAKWLTAHALRSGLAEQYATDVGGITMTVELRWIKRTDVYQVMVMRQRQVHRLTQYPTLAEARAGFLNEQKRASRPTERTGS